MHPHPASGAAESAPSSAPRDTEAYPLEFTGSAGAYFRVWIVNLLLCCVTVGIYTPWARRRTAQYFYSNTLVAHSPLEFTGRLRSMVLGFVLVLLLLLARDIASITGQKLVVTLLLLAAAALVPWAWGSAMRFRFRAAGAACVCSLPPVGARSTAPVGPCGCWCRCGGSCSWA